MKQTVKSILNRLNNKGTIIALASLIVSLLVQFGLNIDSDKIIGIVQTICSILILLGVLNNPVDNSDVYIPHFSDQLIEDKENKKDMENNITMSLKSRFYAYSYFYIMR